MMGTNNCVYETPCGWCSKWDKECDKRMHTSSYRMKHPKPLVFTCQSDADHEWECVGVSTAGTTYQCKKCYAQKNLPFTSSTYSTTTV